MLAWVGAVSIDTFKYGYFIVALKKGNLKYMGAGVKQRDVDIMKISFLNPLITALIIGGVCATSLLEMAFAAQESKVRSGAVDDQQNAQVTLTQSEDLETQPLIKPWGYPLDAFDKKTRPQDDFYRFANGGWLDANEIPGDRSGIGFSVVMRERNEARMESIINQLIDLRVKQGSEAQQIRDLYLSFMDGQTIERMGRRPFAKDLARLERLKSHEDVARAMADPTLGLEGPFSLSVNIDSKNPGSYALWASHSGLTMPDRTYYLRESERLEVTREAFRDYVGKVLILASSESKLSKAITSRLSSNRPDVSNIMDTLSRELNTRLNGVLALEKSIAELHWTRAERRNASRTYNPMTLEQLSDFAPGFPWAVFAQDYLKSSANRIIIREKEAFPGLARLFEQTPISVWRDYLLVKYISSNAEFMPKAYDGVRFSFFGKALAGQEQQRDRDRRAIGIVDRYLNQAIGKIYINLFFPERSKELMIEMFENIRSAFRLRIQNLNWMTDETKKQALFKLDNMTAKIAYPEVWRDYSGVRIRSRRLFTNIKNLRLNGYNLDKKRLTQPVNKKEWFRGPQTVNAFYSPTRNEVFIPAGYIQSPLFDPNADPALNYGAIGSIIGHEIGHGFDDQGSKYDAYGNLKNWWTDEDRVAFDALGDRLATQFDQYEPLPGLNVNGRQTLGENIGDLAGMIVGYHAYILSLDGKEAPLLDGFTGPQRFFLGRAQGRRFKRTEASLRRRLLSAPHSPMPLRVNGMIRNMDEWYKEYNVIKGDDLYLGSDERVRIW